MTLPTEFIQQPKAISSYEFTDLASGTAYQKFYLTNNTSHLMKSVILIRSIKRNENNPSNKSNNKIFDESCDINSKFPPKAFMSNKDEFCCSTNPNWSICGVKFWIIW